jgi:hypothetical protein
VTPGALAFLGFVLNQADRGAPIGRADNRGLRLPGRRVGAATASTTPPDEQVDRALERRHAARARKRREAERVTAAPTASIPARRPALHAAEA